MNGVVLFWRYGGWLENEDKPFSLVVPSKVVCETLGVSNKDLQAAFRSWVLNGCEEAFKYEVTPKKWIRIDYSPFLIHEGWVSTVRPWGNHWRGVSERGYSFSVEAIRI